MGPQGGTLGRHNTQPGVRGRPAAATWPAGSQGPHGAANCTGAKNPRYRRGS